MSDTIPTTPSQDYSRLFAEMRAAGLMESRRGRFVTKATLTLLVFAAGWASLVAVGNHWLALVVAGGLGLVFTQVVFFGHDAGHHQLFTSDRGNRLVGLIAGNLLTGLSFGYWEPKHGAHHAHPNRVGRDPDIGAGAVAFTSEVADGRGRIGQLAARWQAWTFFPLLTLEGLGLHVASGQSVWRRRDRRAGQEAVLLVLHGIVYFGAIFWILSPLKAVVFIAVQQGVFGLYLGATFAPNHKGMPTIPEGARLGFAERQVLTARNVKGGRFVTWLLGGLNFQIEHHLFPRMPMANLARSQPLVRAFCAEQGLDYHEDSLIGSYRTGLAHLDAVGNGGAGPRLAGVPLATL